jgi:hypothetical protein
LYQDKESDKQAKEISNKKKRIIKIDKWNNYLKQLIKQPY